MPIIVINPIPGQEEENAEFLEENDLAVWIKKDNNIELELMDIIKDDKKIEQIRENITKFGKPNSAKEILKEVLGE